MSIKIAAVDDNMNFPPAVREKMAANLTDPSTIEGAALASIASDDANAALLATESKTSRAVRNIFGRIFFSDVVGYGYGNSYLYPNYAATPWVDRLPQMLGVTMANRGYSGYRIQDTVNIAHAQSPAMSDGRAARNLPINGYGAVFVYDLLNNLIEADTPANRRTALESLRMFAARASAGSVTPNSDATYITFGSGWAAPLATPDAFDGTSRYEAAALAPGAIGTADQRITLNLPAGTYDLVFMGGGNTYGGYKIAVNGVPHGEISGASVAVPTPGRTNRDKQQFIYTVELAAGSVVTVDIWNDTGITTSMFWIFDCLLRRGDHPMLVAVHKPLPVPNTPGHNKPAFLSYLQSVVDTVAAEFPNVVAIDATSDWNPATMLGADNLHPNELGQQYLADVAAEALSARMMQTLHAQAFHTDLVN